MFTRFLGQFCVLHTHSHNDTAQGIYLWHTGQNGEKYAAYSQRRKFILVAIQFKCFGLFRVFSFVECTE